MKKSSSLLLLGLLLLCSPMLLAQDASCSRGYLGIHTEEVSEDKAALLNLANPHGSYITRIIPGSAAATAGLQVFDYIYGIDDARTTRQEDLTDLLSAHQPDTEVLVHYVRNKQEATTAVTLKPYQSYRFDRPREEDPFFGVSEHRINEDDEIGVRVEVVRNSTAEKMGLQDDDVILSINGHTMIEWDDVSTAIDNIPVGQSINVNYQRGEQTFQKSLPIESLADAKPNRQHVGTDEYAFLGINSTTLSSEKAKKLGFENRYGSYVTSVIDNTAAQRAGIQPLDYIYGIDEYRTGEGQYLTHILRKYEPGDPAVVHFIRKAKNRSADVVFGSRNDARSSSKDKCEEAFFGIQQSHTRNPTQGVSVNIISNSTAKSLGLQNNDVITNINGYTMIDWDDISGAINSLEVGDIIRVTFSRSGNTRTVEGPIKSYCETKSNSYSYDYDEPDDDDFEEGDDKNDTWSIWNNRSDEKVSPTPKSPKFAKVQVEVQDLGREDRSKLRSNNQLKLPNENNLDLQQLKLTPNVSEGTFALSFDLQRRGNTVVRMYNNAGRLIYEYDKGTFSGRFNDKIDILQNGPGNYYLLVSQDDRSHGRKIILRGS